MSYKGPWVGGASATVCDLARCCEFQTMNACKVTYVIGELMSLETRVLR